MIKNCFYCPRKEMCYTELGLAALAPDNESECGYYDIKEIREEAEMTQVEFANYFGIPTRTLQNWEGNVNKCPDYLIELIRYKLVTEGIIQE